MHAYATTDPTCGIEREQHRLDALDRYDILDTAGEETFDRITRLVRRLFGVPMATITFIDGHRQWFKSRQGLAAAETPRGPALCNYAVETDGALVVPDLLADERFKANPFVVGEPNLRFYAGVPLRTPKGVMVGTLCAMDTRPRPFSNDDLRALSDLALVVVDLLELRIQATRDALTGALSRRAFREAGERALGLARRHRHDLACLMLDIDHFKAVNDRHGHAVGDDVLRAVAAACTDELRATDIFGRLGGEEFGIVLPLTGTSVASDVAERLRAAIGRLSVPTSAGPIAVTASLGLAGLDRSVDTLETLLAQADKALYAAKADGRDRCVTWQPAAALPSGLKRRVLKAGRIVFNAGRSTVDCTIRALSDREASLDVVSTAGVPGTFKLQIDSDGISKLCRILGSSERRLEVAFQQ